MEKNEVEESMMLCTRNLMSSSSTLVLLTYCRCLLSSIILLSVNNVNAEIFCLCSGIMLMAEF